jgi:hypothetical protein
LTARAGQRTAGLKKAMKIVFDEFLSKWNDRAVPEEL